MDIERTMQFIVDTLADVAVKQQVAEVRATRAEQRMDRAEERMDRAEVRTDKLERQMKGIQTLVKIGMKLMVDIQKGQKRTDQKMAELAEAHKDTERQFKAWLESMRSNGHKGSNGNRRKPN
jgi:predicted  nucleic acid-binding Zn-ribbon protein